MQRTTRQSEDVLVVDMSGSLDTSTSGAAYDEMVSMPNEPERRGLRGAFGD